MFYDAECIFRQKNEHFKMKNMICEQISEVCQNFLESKYPNAPKCHLKLLMNRFTKARAHFFAFNTDQKEKIQIQKEIEQEAAASKTSKSMIEIK